MKLKQELKKSETFVLIRPVPLTCARHDSDVTERNKQYDFAKPRKARDLYLQRGEVDSISAELILTLKNRQSIHFG